MIKRLVYWLLLSVCFATFTVEMSLITAKWREDFIAENSLYNQEIVVAPPQGHLIRSSEDYLRPSSLVSTAMFPGFTLGDLEAAEREVPAAQWVYFAEAEILTAITDRGSPLSLNVVAASASFPQALGYELIAGSTFTPEDVRQRKRLLVLSGNAAARLSGGKPIVGQILRVNPGFDFTVIGVARFAQRYGAFRSDLDGVIPIGTLGEEAGMDRLRVVPRPGAGRSALEQLQFWARDRYRGQVEARATFDRLSQFYAQRRASNAILSLYVVITLMVGISAVATLVATTMAQDIWRIGLLRALGASQRRILSMSLGAGVGQALVGSLLGIPLSYVFLKLLQEASDPGPGLRPSTTDFLVALGLSVALSVLIGLFPAVRAARIAPAVALRQGGK